MAVANWGAAARVALIVAAALLRNCGCGGVERVRISTHVGAAGVISLVARRAGRLVSRARRLA